LAYNKTINRTSAYFSLVWFMYDSQICNIYRTDIEFNMDCFDCVTRNYN